MSISQSHSLAVTRTARYYQAGELSEHTRQLWVVCHGYGQLAQFFIRHFHALAAADDSVVIVAPEALSRFYLEGTSGRIGATWMTREDRLAEITDYVAYLDQLTNSLRAQCSPATQLVVLGFSQGAATVSRWVALGQHRPHHLVLWAGAFPSDIDFAVAAPLAQQVPITLVCGEQDAFITDADLATQVAFLHQLGCEPTIRRFPGGHALDANVLQDLHQALRPGEAPAGATRAGSAS